MIDPGGGGVLNAKWIMNLKTLTSRIEPICCLVVSGLHGADPGVGDIYPMWDMMRAVRGH